MYLCHILIQVNGNGQEQIYNATAERQTQKKDAILQDNWI
jgi:hypothetical protein